MKQKQFFMGDANFNWKYAPCSNYFDTISLKNFPVAFFSVVGIMAEDCNYHIKICYGQDRRVFFEGYYPGHHSELMLRYGKKSWLLPESSLLISEPVI